MGWMAAAGILGGLAGNAMSFMGQKSANKTNRQLMERQLAWERERAQNAHQWEVQDLRKAGLNPILSANNGAMTGSVSAPTMQNPAAGFGADATNAISSAFENKLKQKTLKDIDASVEQKKATAKRERSLSRYYSNTAQGVDYENERKKMINDYIEKGRKYLDPSVEWVEKRGTKLLRGRVQKTNASAP